MAVFNGVFPILPGKEQGRKGVRCRLALGSAAKGSTSRRAGTRLTRETGLYRRPLWGASCWCGSRPPYREVFTGLATSDDEFSIWFRGQVKDVTGVDLSDSTQSPPPYVLVDWTSWKNVPPL